MKSIVIYYLATVLMFVLTFVLFNLGMDHINFDSGVSPYITFPIAVLMILIGICMYNKAQRLVEERTWEKLRKNKK